MLVGNRGAEASRCGSQILLVDPSGNLVELTTAERLEELTDVPTMAASVPGYEASGWSGVVASKNTPTEIINRLNKEIGGGMMFKTVPERPEFAAYAARLSARPAAQRAEAKDKELAAG
jgi:tripartite-type tricarboxylate transporter receptor subunit TctC